MSVRRVPPLATWLLERAVVASCKETLVGDLSEQFRQGRSTAWYWRQTLRAIVVCAVDDVQRQTGLAVLAVGLSYILLVAAGYAASAIHDASGIPVWNWTVNHGFDGMRVWWFGGSGARYQPTNPMLVVQACVPVLVGWAIARLFGSRAPATVLCCAAFWTCVVSTSMLRWLTLDGTPVPIVALHPWSGAAAIKFIPMVNTGRFFALMNFLLVPFSIFLGGMLGRAPTAPLEHS